MTVELYPAIIERTAGTPGASDAAGRIRRPTPVEIEAVAQAQLAWMAQQSVLARAAGAATSIALAPSTVLGRAATGDLRALTPSDLDALLGLTGALAGKAPNAHGHSIADVALLQEVLSAVSRIGHRHTVGDFDAPGVPTGHVLTKVAPGSGGLGWAPPAGGGGGGLLGPLLGDITLEGFRVLCDATSGLEVLRCSGGRLFLLDRKLPLLSEGTPQPGQVWIYDSPGVWVHRPPTAADIVTDPIGDLLTETLAEQLAELLTLVGARAVVGHGHALADIAVPGGATVGHVVTVGSGGAWVLEAPPSGGGLSNPLTAHLDIGSFALKSGSVEVLKYAGGKFVLGGREVFPAAIATPLAGHVAVYNAVSSLFENRLLTADEVTVDAYGDISAGTVQEVFEALTERVLAATIDDADGLTEGDTNKFATSTSVAAAGAVMVSAISDDETLAGDDDATVVSERAIKAYVAAEVAAGGLGGVPAGASFPSSPSVGDQFLRTDLREVFVASTSPAAWVSAHERSIDLPLPALSDAERVATKTPSGTYIYGSGNVRGFRVPFNSYLTGLSIQLGGVDTGTIRVRKAAFAGSVTDALEEDLVATSGLVSLSSMVAVSAGDLLSVHASDFSSGITQASISIFYRRRYATA